ncbi:MAG: response regulator, partial [Chloroflexota bacterium]
VGAVGRIELVLPTSQQPTVLIVDDNPGMRRLMRRYLTGRSYLVLEAPNAADALRLASEVQPDAVTLDLMMPTTDGWELLQALRSQPRTREIPIVVCSVLKERDLALSLGAADFLAKPISRDALLQALSAVVATG